MNIVSQLVGKLTAFTQPKPQAVQNTAIVQAAANFGYTRAPSDQYGIPLYMPVFVPPGHAQALDNITTRSRLAPVNGGGFS